MKILLAPNSMKGSLSPFRFADLLEQGLRESPGFDIRKIPVADGGDFTFEVLMVKLGLDPVEIPVRGPLGKTVRAMLGYADGIALIEIAKASGLKLLRPEERDPLKASSFGTGQLIAGAIQLGARTIYIGLGGSATVDAGMGMLEALGWRFYDAAGNLLPGNGENLLKIDRIDPANQIRPDLVKIKIIADVGNPLCGARGAARVFGPQKGGTPEMIEILENGIRHFAALTRKLTGKSVEEGPGMGAAGGMAAGLVAWLHAEIVPGADFILDALSFDQSAEWADLIITGEGRIDHQTLANKAPFAVARRAKKYGKKVIAVAGSVDLTETSVFDAVFSMVSHPCSLEFAMENAEAMLYRFSGELGRLIAAVSGLKDSGK